MTGDALRGSLAGVRVLDASRVLAGPFCGQMLADLGAEVIKIEDPKSGDETRGWGPPFDAAGMSAYFMACNRGKKSVALDLTRAVERDVFLRLTAKSDILIENFKASSAKKLGITANDLHAVNPRLIICRISGFGAGPLYGGLAGYDFVVQGLSGMMAATGPQAGPPHKFGVAIADIASGLYTGVAALAALHARQTSGHGYAVDVALIDCAVAAMANVAQAYLTSGKVPQRQGNAHLQIVPYQLFQTADSWLVLAVGNDTQWQKFCAAAGGDAGTLGQDPRFLRNQDRVANRAVLVPLVEAVMRSHTTAAWQKVLDGAGVPCGPVWDFAGLFASDLAAERGLKVTVKRPDGTPVTLVRSPLVRDLAGAAAPPPLGSDTEAVLRDVLGLSVAEVTAIMKSRS